MKFTAALCLCFSHSLGAVEPCRIDVVDAESGWPVPLVELRTTHGARFVSDNAGVIAFDLPELMGVETWFFVEGLGYEVPKDGFGYRGVKRTPTPGGRLTVKVQRKIAAKRLGRLTGGGLFGESQKLGFDLDWKESGALGADSVQTAAHAGKLYWAWGDTNLPGYPLGVFHTSSATTSLKPLGAFEPPVKMHFEYFRDQKQKPRGVAKMPGEGPTWLIGYVSLPDKSGTPRLCAHYTKIRGFLTAYEAGLCVWNEEASQFERLKVLWESKASDEPCPKLQPTGHPVIWTDADGSKWVLFGDPFPHMKCPASFEGWSDPTKWVALDAPAEVDPKEAGEPVRPHRGSIAWSGFLEKWVCIFVQEGGEPSHLGEVWFAESDAPFGPWRSAVKVLTHDNYSFYNPRLHPEFTPAEAPFILFEGTYSQSFADRPVPTARYDYNQVLYRLDLVRATE